MALLPIRRRGLALKLGRLSLIVCALALLEVVRLWLPVTQVILGVVQDLAGLGTMGVWVTVVTRDNGGVVQEMQEAPAVAGQNNLLLCPLDGGEELRVIGLLELLTSLRHQS